MRRVWAIVWKTCKGGDDLEKTAVKNKMAVINVLAGLVKNPALITDDKFPLSPEDFPERFHKIVYGALEHLARGGAKFITEVVVDDYLMQYPKQHQIFADNHGMDYIVQAMNISDVQNFEYYYNSLKKCSLLNELQSKGFDISSFYNPDVIHADEQQELQTKLDSYTLEQIVDSFDASLSGVRNRYCSDSDMIECHISKGMRDLKKELGQRPEFGLPMNSAKMTTICHGRRLRKLYLKSLPSSGGKSRLSMADACRLAIPEYYDPEKKAWVKTSCKESVLFITTELEMSEIQTLLWAYVACVPEDHIIDHKYDPGEEERIDRAIELVEASDFYSVFISNFDVDDIENVIKRHVIEHQVKYVFFDYLHSSAKIFTESSVKTRGAIKLREDQILMMFSDRLKTLCNRYDIHIDTSTQVNDDYKSQKNPDQSVIRGAKAIADKVDIGYIGLEPSEKDKVAIQTIMAQNGASFCKQPNMVYHVYKVRRGKINHVKVFIYFDFGTLRTTDLFVTDRDYKLIDVTNTNIEVLLDDTEIKRDDASLVDSEDHGQSQAEQPEITEEAFEF